MLHLSSRVLASSPARAWPKRSLSIVAVAVTISAWPQSAAADTVVGIDLNFNDASADDDAGAGAGVDVYFGPRLDLAILTLTTELSGGFHEFGGPLDPSVYRLLAGGRLGVGAIIRPSVFAHIGVGHLRFDERVGDERAGHTNLAGDLGAALDFTILPLVDLGIQASYNVVAAGDDAEAFEWLQAGAHVTFVLGGDT